MGPKAADMKPADPEMREFKFGEGSVACNPVDGSIERIEHPLHPEMNFLLGADQAEWHHPPFNWGKGFLITDQGSGRWDHPRLLSVLSNGADADYAPIPNVPLKVRRRFDDRWTERYCLTNKTDATIAIRSFAISIPFRDIYPSARECLKSACHVHLWAGGAFSYVWVTAMNGRGPGLGLVVDKGELWSYSVESRTQWLSSNARGHLYLHVTDAARAPHAMGGQPEIAVAPDHAYELAWTLGWYDDFAAFERAALRPPVSAPVLTALVGEPIAIMSSAQEPVTLRSDDGISIVSSAPGGFAARSDEPGVKHIDVVRGAARSRIAVLFHRPVRQIVEQRIDFIIRHQRASERGPDRSGAFLPYDNESGLTMNGGDWRDWSDCRERLAMPILLQTARLRGWGDAGKIDASLLEYDRFFRANIVDAKGNVAEDSYHRHPDRLYNFPWAAAYVLNRYRLIKERGDLLLAAAIFDRYYERGGTRFLAFVAETITDIIAECEAAGEGKIAGRLRGRLIDHADYFIGLGTDLPKHEVHYEQSVVAPLVQLLEAAYCIQPDTRYAAALKERIPWLLAFAGCQPHVRLRHIPIRHWDGYWFGRNRQWGDTMPHYWSVLSAAALLDWPAALAGPKDRVSMARAILDANLAHFREDGSATCAFVYPSCVNGNPGYHEDPLANDQDWALVYYLRYEGLLKGETE
jgi:hypothetical protein